MMSPVTKISLSRRQSAALAAIGLFLILGGAAHAQVAGLPNGGLSQSVQTPQFPSIAMGSRSSQPAAQLGANGVSWGPGQPFMYKTVEPDLSMADHYNYMFKGNIENQSINHPKSSVYRIDQPNLSQKSVPNGWYAVTAVVLLADREEDTQTDPATRFQSAADPAFVEVKDGYFHGLKLHFKFPWVPATAMSDELVLEFIPLKENCLPRNYKHLRPGLYESCINEGSNGEPNPFKSQLHLRPGYTSFIMSVPFVPLQQTGSGDTPTRQFVGSANLFKTSLHDFAVRMVSNEQARMQKTLADRPTPEAYAQQHKLTFVNVDDPNVAWAGKQFYTTPDGFQKELKEILTQPALGDLRYQHRDAFTSAVCRLAMRLGPYGALSMDYRTVQACRDQFKQHMRLTRVIHTGLVNTINRPKRLLNVPIQLGVGVNAIKSRSHSQDSSQSTSASFSASASVSGNITELDQFLRWTEKTPLNFGASASLSRNYNHGTSQSDASIEQGVLSTGDVSQFDPVVLRVQTFNSRACLQVLSSDTNRVGRVYICSQPLSELDLIETYAHIYSKGDASSQVSPFERGSQVINRQLHGDAEITGFFWSLRNAITAHNDQQFPSNFTQKAETFLQSNPLSLPGLSVTPVMINDEVEYSAMETFFSGYQQRMMDENPAPRID